MDINGIFPKIANPDAIPNIFCSAIPTSKNLSGCFFLKISDFVTFERLASNTIISLFLSPNSVIITPYDSLVTLFTYKFPLN